MKFVFACVAVMVAVMFVAEITAGEINPIQKDGPVQKVCPPAGPCQKSIQKTSVQKCGPVGIPCLTPPVYKQTLCSRIRRNREFRKIGRVRVEVRMPSVNVCVGPCCR